ncbi:hypothetical protein BFN03_14035 [Rhodococcus sp. WMMA185]|nr:hypothetical protein [Rhodococcus sp. WMMA185]AOW93387.1 hypothetical protein BFN03_14035 [Rhodococcus sp. WMMA185]
MDAVATTAAIGRTFSIAPVSATTLISPGATTAATFELSDLNAFAGLRRRGSTTSPMYVLYAGRNTPTPAPAIAPAAMRETRLSVER